MIVYLNGSYLPKDEARISPDDRGFLFGDGVYEGLRAYDAHVFRAEAHWQRLRRSLAEVQMTVPSVDLQAIAVTLLERNQLTSGDAFFYLQITRGAAPRQRAFPSPPIEPTIYAFATPIKLSPEKPEAGVSVILVRDDRWSRCNVKAISLLPSVLANQAARVAGAAEAVFVRDGVLTEGTHTNFGAVRDGTFITHPEGNSILSGITRGVVLELCRELRIPIAEEPIAESDLMTLDEAMLLGTTVEITPVTRINDLLIGSGTTGGPVTRRLQRAFREMIAKEKIKPPSPGPPV